MNCDCTSWARVEPIDLTGVDAHHHRCELYSKEKRPRLFYWEEAYDAWVPAPDKIENIVDVGFTLDPDEETEVRFRRSDLTDKEMAELPDADGDDPRWETRLSTAHDGQDST